MNGDMDFMVLNGKLKDIQGSNARQENSLSAIDEKMTDVSDKMTDVSNKMDNLSVDVSIGAYIVCRGTIGTKFTLTRTDGYYPEMTAEITENSLALPNDLYAVIVPVPCGNYSIKIDVNGTIMTATVNASAVGQHYTFSYSSFRTLGTFTTDGTFTVPADVSTIYIDAIGGGAGGDGGASGHSGSKGNTTHPGGSGGSGGSGGLGGGNGTKIEKKEYTVTPGSAIEITIGTGGRGGTSGSPGTAGSATVIGDLVTLPGGVISSSYSNKGGTGGTGGNESSDYSSGTSGSGRGGAGGDGGASGNFSYKGERGHDGKDASNAMDNGGGGATANTNSSGGGGGYGGDGFHGKVIIYSGMQIK